MIQITIRIIKPFNISNRMLLSDNLKIKCFLISIWRRSNQGKVQALIDLIMIMFWIQTLNIVFKGAIKRVTSRIEWDKDLTNSTCHNKSLELKLSMVIWAKVKEKSMRLETCPVSEHTSLMIPWFTINHHQLNSQCRGSMMTIWSLSRPMKGSDRVHI